jgi:DNA-nicking Smr family endonuclease
LLLLLLLSPTLQWELDLHGLHVQEALQALQQRLELLQDIVQDLATQPQTVAAVHTVVPAAAPAGPEDEVLHLHSRPAGSKKHVLTQLLLSDDQPLHVRQAALSQQLRVIVGKGNHSSAGEASLPRAVEQWLADVQYKYVARPGVIDVKLKRFHALSG